MSSAGARPTTACLAVGATGSKTRSSRCSISAASRRSSSGREAVGHESEDCFDYSPNNPKSNSGSGLLGTGARGAAADGGKNQGAWGRTRSSLSDDSEGRHTGLARPSKVIEVKSESSQGSHSAPFPRALVEFFVRAFSDPRRRGLRSVHGQRNDHGRCGVAGSHQLWIGNQPLLLRCDRPENHEFDRK